MRAAGIVFLIFAGLNIISLIAALIGGAGGDIIARQFGTVVMFGALGGFFLHQAKQKKQEEEDKEKWNNG